MSLEALAKKNDEPTVVPNVKEKQGKDGRVFLDFPKEQVVLKKVELWFPKLDKPYTNERYPTAKPQYSATLVLGPDSNSELVQSVYQVIQRIASRDFVEQQKQGGKVISSTPLSFDKLKEPKLKLKHPKENKEDPNDLGAFVNNYYINVSMGDWGTVEVFKKFSEVGKKLQLMTPEEILSVGSGSIVTVNISLQGYYIKSDNFGVKATIHGVLVNQIKTKGYQVDNESVFGAIEEDEEDLGF